MSECRAPIRDMLLVLNELARLDEIAQMPGSEEASADVVSAVLEEASRFAEENHGLECMFIMMNVARFAVGMEGGGLRTRLSAGARLRQGAHSGQRSWCAWRPESADHRSSRRAAHADEHEVADMWSRQRTTRRSGTRMQPCAGRTWLLSS